MAKSAKICRLPAVDGSERVIGLLASAGLAQPADGGSKNPPPKSHRLGETSTDTSAPEVPHSRPPLPEELPLRSLTPLEGEQRTGRGGRLFDTGGPGSTWGPGTVALRWCSDCGRFLGAKLWPRTGRPLVHTHGLCPACLERMTRDALGDPVLLA